MESDKILLDALKEMVDYGNENYAYHSDTFIKKLKVCQTAIKQYETENPNASKPPFSEEELNELDFLNMHVGRKLLLQEILTFLKKKFDYSDVNVHIIELKKEFYAKEKERQDERDRRFPNSTLNDTLFKRIDWNEKNKKQSHEQ